MYWADWTTNKIQRANRDSSQVEDLLTTGCTGTVGTTQVAPWPASGAYLYRLVTDEVVLTRKLILLR